VKEEVHSHSMAEKSGYRGRTS